MSKIKVAIVGFGGMGRRWAKISKSCGSSSLELIIDNDKNKFNEAKKFNCDFACDLRLLSSPKVDAVVVSTPNTFLAPITKIALQNGKHVLCEKPAGINPEEVEKNIELSLKLGLTYTVGFNHRFHPAIIKAKNLVSSGAVGKIHFIRGIYGHGGRAGYQNEWRNNPELSGGGELLDQGVHLIDLAFWFLGDSFEKIHGTLARNFWSKNLEDNAFITMQNRSGAIVSLHASWTQWQKKFLWEIYGELGHVAVEGLGGKYGLETLKMVRRNICRKLQKEKIIAFPTSQGYSDPDLSLFSLWSEFIGSIKSETQKKPDGNDALNALNVISKIYQEERK